MALLDACRHVIGLGDMDEPALHTQVYRQHTASAHAGFEHGL